MASWIPIPPESDFSLDNLPFGIFSSLGSGAGSTAAPRAGVAVGDSVLDLAVLSTTARFQDLTGLGHDAPAVFTQPTLNAFAARGRACHRRVRAAVRAVLAAQPATDADAFLRDDAALRERAVVARYSVAMHLPMDIGDYTDFYAGVHHARNVGSLFRDPANPLPANYATLPIAYHGRASSVVVSGSPVQRPNGQILAPPAAGAAGAAGATGAAAAEVVVGPSRKLDFELELGCFISRPNGMGTRVRVDDAEEDHIFGFVLLNDWSARDVQSYEYVPLGPFSGKNFATSISPWVVLADALEPFRVPIQEPPAKTFAYLQGRQGARSTMFDMVLEVDLAVPGESPTTITKVSSNQLMWSFAQMVAQHTLSGCPLRTGDLLGTGTISGPSGRPGEYGSLLELSKNGKTAVSIGTSSERTFLLDGDTVTLRGYAVHPGTGGRVGFGECTGTIRPARALE